MIITMKQSNVPHEVDSRSIVYIQMSVLVDHKIDLWESFNHEVEAINGDGFVLSERLVEVMVDAFKLTDRIVKFSYGNDCLLYNAGNIERGNQYGNN